MFFSKHTVFVNGHGDLQDRPSFPTRRSSDLYAGQGDRAVRVARFIPLEDWEPDRIEHVARSSDAGTDRSEEHTSELQSRLHLVCRLLLEKKKEQAAKRDDAGCGSSLHSVALT